MTVLAHRVDGAGEPVLLLNGGMMTVAAWEPLAAALAERFRVIRCDFRGQLLSPGTPPAELAGHVGDLVELLDHLGIDRTHVVGTSFGGQTGLLLAAAHPDRVRSLVAAAVVDHADAAMREVGAALVRAGRDAVQGRPEPFWEALLETVYSPPFLARHRNELAERQERMEAFVPPAWYDAVERLLVAVEAADLRPLLGRISCPLLVIAAGDDRLMPLARSIAVADAVPGARLEVLDGSGHALVVERAERFAALTIDFLARAGEGGGGRE